MSFTIKAYLDLNVGWTELLSSSPGEIASMDIVVYSVVKARKFVTQLSEFA